MRFVNRTTEPHDLLGKAGILKSGVPAVFSHQRSDAAEVLKKRAGGRYTFTDEWPISELTIDARGSRFGFRDLEVICPLAGEHQVENAFWIKTCVAFQILFEAIGDA